MARGKIITNRLRSGFFKLLMSTTEEIVAAIIELVSVTLKRSPLLSKIEKIISKKCNATAKKPNIRTYLL